MIVVVEHASYCCYTQHVLRERYVTVILTHIESIPSLSSIVGMRDDGGAVTNFRVDFDISVDTYCK